MNGGRVTLYLVKNGGWRIAEQTAQGAARINLASALEILRQKTNPDVVRGVLGYLARMNAAEAAQLFGTAPYKDGCANLRNALVELLKDKDYIKDVAPALKNITALEKAGPSVPVTPPPPPLPAPPPKPALTLSQLLIMRAGFDPDTGETVSGTTKGMAASSIKERFAIAEVLPYLEGADALLRLGAVKAVKDLKPAEIAATAAADYLTRMFALEADPSVRKAVVEALQAYGIEAVEVANIQDTLREIRTRITNLPPAVAAKLPKGGIIKKGADEPAVRAAMQAPLGEITPLMDRLQKQLLFATKVVACLETAKGITVAKELEETRREVVKLQEELETLRQAPPPPPSEETAIAVVDYQEELETLGATLASLTERMGVLRQEIGSAQRNGKAAAGKQAEFQGTLGDAQETLKRHEKKKAGIEEQFRTSKTALEKELQGLEEKKKLLAAAKVDPVYAEEETTQVKEYEGLLDVVGDDAKAVIREQLDSIRQVALKRAVEAQTKETDARIAGIRAGLKKARDTYLAELLAAKTDLSAIPILKTESIPQLTKELEAITDELRRLDTTIAGLNRTLEGLQGEEKHARARIKEIRDALSEQERETLRQISLADKLLGTTVEPAGKVKS